PMRIGFVGCGFTADHYVPSLKLYPELELAGALDRDEKRASEFCAFHSIKQFPSLGAMLADPSIEMIVNLTNSSSHFEVSKACLEAGKHVYTEKPLSTTFAEAQTLVNLAEANGLYFSSAPCILLGETAQTLWKALEKNEIGKVRVVYAELEDGPFHLAEPHLWRSASGAEYDYRGEFEMGVTMEHAGYYLGWFTAFFGPAKSITGFASCLWPEKPISPQETLHVTTPDFSVACITFESGVIARLTCSLVGPYNHTMKMVGDKGVLSVDECWNFSSPVFLEKYSQLKFKIDRYPISKSYPFLKHLASPRRTAVTPVRKSSLKKQQVRYRLDYVRGIADLARAVAEKRSPRLPADYCLHVTELALAMQNVSDKPYQLTTTFKPLKPMDDAELKAMIPSTW
ncbi:MAG TPA: Gfo/Idh/MocA family oxidoreductase, partial [Candidatus Acidoferrales bacterium]